MEYRSGPGQGKIGQSSQPAIKRVQAGSRPAQERRASSLKKLARREVSARGNWAFKRTSSEEKFRNFSLQGEYDTFDAKAAQVERLSFLKRRSRIVEIVAAKDLLFTLAHSGACAAICLESRRRLCYMNVGSEEVIRSLFFNKNNESLITVSVYAQDNFSSLKCRSTPLERLLNYRFIPLRRSPVTASPSPTLRPPCSAPSAAHPILTCAEVTRPCPCVVWSAPRGVCAVLRVPCRYIRRGRPSEGFALFESESLRWPGFVEFDDVNGKVLTYSADNGYAAPLPPVLHMRSCAHCKLALVLIMYKVFDLRNYTLLYSVPDSNIQEIKISPGIMLLIYNRAEGHVPLKILSIEDGAVLASFVQLLQRGKKVDFIEQFNEKLLVKQENDNLHILDVRTREETQVSRTEFMTPSAFIFLYENQLFLTFRNRAVAVWNFRGEMVTAFEDHELWYPDCNTNNIYITSDQDLIISYCKHHHPSHAPHGQSTPPPRACLSF
ncbi:unnamed protein product [Closterium sp. NIES-64]|nr:unnamed protein product [Closterium sp. NIES-64]